MAIPLIRSGAPKRSTTSRPARQLSVVPARRRVAWFAVTLTVMLAAVMMGAVALHTTIAERQLEIDDLERGVRSAQQEFDVLRAERAELRSPTRIAAEAAAIGMVVGSESKFVAVDPMTLAITIARTGTVPVDDQILVGGDQQLEPLDQFRLVKRVSAEAP
jgi:cell division protein FtsL